MNLLGLGQLADDRREDTFLFLIILLFFLTPTSCNRVAGVMDSNCNGNGNDSFVDGYGEYSILILLIILQFLR